MALWLSASKQAQTTRTRVNTMKTKNNQMAGKLKCVAVVLAALAVLALPAKAAIVYSFGSGANTFSINFNAVNASLEMGRTEILRSDCSSYYG